MTQQSPAFAIQASSHGAELFRRAISTLIGSAGGIVASGDYAITQNGTPNMSVNVAGGLPGGQIWVPGTSSSQQGQYYAFNDATVNLAIAASNPSNPRIDVPVVQVQDAAYAGAVNSASLSVVTGTPAGSPVAPSVPASSLALANVAVAALATTVVTANITDRRSRVAPAALAPGGLAIASLVDPTTGKVIGSSGGAAAAVFPPGYEIGYDALGNASITVAGTSEGTATTIIACAAHTFDGAPVWVEFFSPGVQQAVSSGAVAVSCTIFLQEGATTLGLFGDPSDGVSTGTSSFRHPFYARYRFTPSAGSHTYTIAAYRSSTASPTVYSGVGGTGNYLPAFARFTKA